MNDYIHDKKHVSIDKTIQLREQRIEEMHKHFKYLDKDAQVVVQFTLTVDDYVNMQYIAKHADLLNGLIKKYSSLGIVYSSLSPEEISLISSSLTLECTFDMSAKKIIINEKKLSSQDIFVLLYLRTIELVQICIDIYNEFERKEKDAPLIPLKNGIAFIGIHRSLNTIPHIVDPHMWSELIGDKDSP
jgi:hypothetical protein